MAELDRFEKTFTAGWRAAYNYARGGAASDSEISDKLIKSLTRTLREHGGIPGLKEMGGVVANGLGASLDASFTALDGIVRDHDGHRHAKGSGRRRKVHPRIREGGHYSRTIE